MKTKIITLAAFWLIAAPIPHLSAALPDPSPPQRQQSAQDATALITQGTWSFHKAKRVFAPDGSLASNNYNAGHWEIVNGELDVYLGVAKHAWRFYLPINPAGTKGIDTHGNPTVLTQISLKNEEVQPAQSSATANPDPPVPPDEPKLPPEGPPPPPAPLPAGKDAPYQERFCAIYTGWYNRNITAHYPADKDPTGAAFIRDAIAELGADSAFSFSDHLIKEEQAINIDTATEPALLLMIGKVDPKSDRVRAALTKALALLPASDYPKYLSFMAASGLEYAGKATDAADQVSLQYLNASMHDDSFQPDEIPALRWFFDHPAFRMLLGRKPDAVVASFKSAPGMAPWLAEYVEGMRYVNDAWICRGNDTADKVTPKGWEGFRNNYAIACPWLIDSWNKNPHDPAAATEMIQVVYSGAVETSDTAREWFDRAVAADFDFWPAYLAYEQSLMPIWGGSHDAMVAFGRECEATGRYDTMVPNMLISVELNIVSDTGDWQGQFKDPVMGHELLNVIDNYFKQPHPCINILFTQTFAAIIGDKIGDENEVDQHMAAIHYKPEYDNWLVQMDDLRVLTRRAKADNDARANAGPGLSN